MFGGHRHTQSDLSAGTKTADTNGCGSIEVCISGSKGDDKKHDSQRSELDTTWPSWPRHVVRHTGFVVAVNAAIVLSAAQMGVQAEMGVEADGILALIIFENLFTALFTVEMLLKLYVNRQSYFTDMWNILDFLVVWVSIVHAWVVPALSPSVSSGSNLAVIKVFRLLRLLRIIKLTNSIPTLRMVVQGLIGSTRALFWVVLLLALIVYLFAIICVEVIGSSPHGTYPGYDNSTNLTSSLTFQNYNNFEYFGTVTRAMATLFSMSILAEWDSFRPVWEFQPWCTPVIAMLIFCTTFGIVNVIIGVIVEHTTNSMNELVAAEEEKDKQMHMANIRSIAIDLWKSDQDGDNNISREEMRTAAADPLFVKHFRELDLPKGFTFDDLYDMLNLDGQDGLSYHEFIGGMHRMIFGTEFQKTCLMMLGMGQIKELHRDMVKGQRTYLDGQFARLREDFQALRTEVRSSRIAAGSPVAPQSPPWTDGPSLMKAEEPIWEDLDPSMEGTRLLPHGAALAHSALEEARCWSGDRDAPIAVAPMIPPEKSQRWSSELSPMIAAMVAEVVAEVDSGGAVAPVVSEVALGDSRSQGASEGGPGDLRSLPRLVPGQSPGRPQEDVEATQITPHASLTCPMVETSETANLNRGNCAWVFRSFA